MVNALLTAVCESVSVETEQLPEDEGKTVTETTYVVPSSGNVITVFEEEDGTVWGGVTEHFEYEMEKGKLSLKFPGRNEGTMSLRYSLDGDSIYLNDAISRTATVSSIAVAALVYFLFIFVLRAITADDVRLLPKGAKIERLLRKVKLIS